MAWKRRQAPPFAEKQPLLFTVMHYGELIGMMLYTACIAG